ncbi:MAG TPA: aminodeoxychorismate synthase component I [Verrucomicrobiae bacterium]
MCSQAGSALLHDPATQRWLRFRRLLEIFEARSIPEVMPLLARVQEEVERRPCFAVGFVSYEAAPAFDPAFKVVADRHFPLAWFGLFEKPEVVSGPETMPKAAVWDWRFPVGLKEYGAAVQRIKSYIRTGETYQVNYTLRLTASGLSKPAELFAAMVQAQGPHYGALIETSRYHICSASPELFFRLEGEDLVCRPMKGTAPRGLWPAQDREKGTQTLCSEKNRAENIMIVDMVRNDMGQIADVGSVGVKHLFTAEKYPTLWQMTSTVTCRTKQSVSEIFRALFPAASITGAPKVRTMQIIAELETQPRRIYTGAIGFIAPGREAQFSVAIRTVLADRGTHKGEYGVGGGIVWDSIAEQEFEECRTKAKVLAAPIPEFDLLETLLWTPAGGFALREEHLGRLADSAAYFSFLLSLDEVRERLDVLASSLPRLPQRVRLLLSAAGEVTLEPQPLALLPQPYRVTLARTPVNSHDVSLYHKTTQREVYDRAFAGRGTSADVLLWNERRELTESTLANLVVEIEGRLLTPPLECGLLPGVYRKTLLDQRRVREGIVRVEDLARCGRIYLVNSVRGMREVSWDHAPVGRPPGNSPHYQRSVRQDIPPQRAPHSASS